MKPLEVSKQINAGQDAVFAVFSDLEKIAERITDIVKLEILARGDKVGVGTRWRETRVMFGKQATEEMEITSFTAPTGYRVEAKSHGSHYISEYRFQSQGQGTLVTMTFRAEPLNLFTRVMGFLMAPMMRKTMVNCLDKDMTDLKTQLESK